MQVNLSYTANPKLNPKLNPDICMYTYKYMYIIYTPKLHRTPETKPREKERERDTHTHTHTIPP